MLLLLKAVRLNYSTGFKFDAYLNSAAAKTPGHFQNNIYI